MESARAHGEEFRRGGLFGADVGVEGVFDPAGAEFLAGCFVGVCGCWEGSVGGEFGGEIGGLGKVCEGNAGEVAAAVGGKMGGHL